MVFNIYKTLASGSTVADLQAAPALVPAE